MTTAWEIFRFEVGYQLQRRVSWIYFALFGGLAIATMAVFVDDARRDGYFFNSPIIIAAVTIICGIIGLLITAAVASDAATRDGQTRLSPLVYTAPVGKRAYLGGRVLGAFVVNALLLAAVPLGMLITTRLPFVEPAIVGPERAAAYASALVLLALPNAFIATVLLFSLALLTRKAMASYAGAGLLFLATTLSQTVVAGKLGLWDLAKRIDPAAFVAMRAMWTSSTPAQRNTLLFSLDQALLTNRLLWIGGALTLLALAYLRFRFAHETLGGRSAAIEKAAAVEWSVPVAAPHPRRAFNWMTRVRQTLAVSARSVGEIARSKGQFVVLAILLLVIGTAPELLEIELGTPSVPLTAHVLPLLGGNEIGKLLAALITLFAGQLVWREREARLNAIADVTPVPDWLTLLGKFFGLAFVIVAIHAALVASGVIVQALQGYYDFELGVYARAILGLELADFLLFAVAAMLVHVLISHKYLAHVIAIVFYLFIDNAGDLGVEHKLLVYNSDTGWSYSDMRGFGASLEPWLAFKLHWAAWALLLGAIAYLFWVRGEEQGLAARFRLARRRLTRVLATFAMAAVTLVAITGGFIFYNTNVLNEYRSSATEEKQRADYERQYGKFASLAQPVIISKKLHVEIYPAKQRADVRGTYRLQNKSAAAIEAIHVVMHPDVESNMRFDRRHRLAQADAKLGYRVFELEQPLQPGETMQLHFDVIFAPRGFTNRGVNAAVVANGTYFGHMGDKSPGSDRLLPQIGYQSSREIGNAGVRAKYGLPARPEVRSLYDRNARFESDGAEKIEFEAIVGTDADQTAVAPGTLRRTWVENGRRYFHYGDLPIRNLFAFFSARYALYETRWKNVPIQVYYHPGHAWNIERMVRGVRASLDYYSREFSPYQYGEIRLVEYPGSTGGLRLRAYPGLIMYSEGFAAVSPEDDARDLDLPFAVLAHEIAHQWWGHQVVPAHVEGAPLLTESLAWYSAMMVVEESLGREHLERLVTMMRREYEKPRAEREVPLLRSYNRFDAYREGPFAMWTLREAVGEEKVNVALRRLLAKYGTGRPPYPTSLDLYGELKAVTPPAKQELLRDLFEGMS